MEDPQEIKTSDLRLQQRTQQREIDVINIHMWLHSKWSFTREKKLQKELN